MALQSDGRIILAGGAVNGQAHFALAHYNSDGSLDTAFGTGGLVLADFGDTFSGAGALAVQPDGRIVAAGGFADANFNNQEFALARYQGR